MLEKVVKQKMPYIKWHIAVQEFLMSDQLNVNVLYILLSMLHYVSELQKSSLWLGVLIYATIEFH